MDQPFLITPALRDCAEDRALHSFRSILHVYVCLHSILEPHAFRRCKAAALAHTLGMKPHTVSRSMATLARHGYLERRYVAKEGYEYRLLLTRHKEPVMPPSGISRGAA